MKARARAQYRQEGINIPVLVNPTERGDNRKTIGVFGIRLGQEIPSQPFIHGEDDNGVIRAGDTGVDNRAGRDTISTLDTIKLK